MASDISYKNECIWVSNQFFSTLIDFALTVGDRKAGSLKEKAFVQRLREENESGQFYPGCSFDLDEQFPTVDEKKFWLTVFCDMAQDIFLRRLGNQEIDTWQVVAICDICLVGRMLNKAVRESEVK